MTFLSERNMAIYSSNRYMLKSKILIKNYLIDIFYLYIHFLLVYFVCFCTKIKITNNQIWANASIVTWLSERNTAIYSGATDLSSAQSQSTDMWLNSQMSLLALIEGMHGSSKDIVPGFVMDQLLILYPIMSFKI